MLMTGLAWTCICSAQSPVSGTTAQITLKLRPIPAIDTSKAKLWDELFNISKPVSLRIEANEPIENAVARQCGSAPSDLVAYVAGLNVGGGGRVEGSTRFWRSFPCPYVAFDTVAKPLTIPVSKNQALADILPFHMGESGPKTVAAVKLLNPGVLTSNGTIRASTELRLPYVVKGTTIELRDAFASAPTSAVQKVALVRPQLASDAVFVRNAPTATQNYKFVAEDMLATDVDSSNCAGPPDANSWPFDLNAALALVERGRKAFNAASPEAVILVADTGFESSLKPSGLLWVNRRVNSGNGSVTDYTDDLHGANLFSGHGDIRPTGGSALSSHGSEVFGVIAGGRGDVAKLATYVVIAGGKITNDSLGVIDRTALHDSFRYATQIARQNPSVILNLSAVSTGQILGLEDALRAINFLVVAAAGNNHDRVDLLNIYPPAFSDYRDRLLVVGAHDWNSKLAEFSNSGMLVDLLAPGCKINVRDGSGKTVSVSGTSFAAPFVSQTAGMLSAIGLKSWEVKNRIMASVDFDANLVGIVGSGGRLNVLNALRVGSDILEVRDPNSEKVSTLFGTIDSTTSWICHTAGASKLVYRPSSIARVIRGYPGFDENATQLTLNPQSKGGLIYQPPCKSFTGTVRFAEDGKEFEDIDMANVVSIISRAIP